jgi:hypothetical protein
MRTSSGRLYSFMDWMSRRSSAMRVSSKSTRVTRTWPGTTLLALKASTVRSRAASEMNLSFQLRMGVKGSECKAGVDGHTPLRLNVDPLVPQCGISWVDVVALRHKLNHLCRMYFQTKVHVVWCCVGTSRGGVEDLCSLMHGGKHALELG